MSLAPLRLKAQEERRLNAGHLWIYSNEIDTTHNPLSAFAPGQLVRIESHQNKKLGVGYINPQTLLCARLLTRNPREVIDVDFFVTRIAHALKLRETLFALPYYRLVFGESDRLPGLVIDRYGDAIVAQITTAGMEQFKDIIIQALEKILQPASILWRNDGSIRKLEGLDLYITPGLNNPPEQITLLENEVKFQVSIKSGQKTGWFYDHRDNRARANRYAKNRRVLDLFSYVGGWGVQAAVNGAASVLCVDSSKDALQYLMNNAQENAVAEKVSVICKDVFDALTELHKKNEKFDMIILDPPAFIKKRKDIAAGIIAYQRVNEAALRLIAKDGIFITSSCSLLLSMEDLLDVVRKASLKTERQIQILELGHQGPDHPIHPAISETAYLKAIFCRVY